jgi:hypothetical protein
MSPVQVFEIPSKSYLAFKELASGAIVATMGIRLSCDPFGPKNNTFAVVPLMFPVIDAEVTYEQKGGTPVVVRVPEKSALLAPTLGPWVRFPATLTVPFVKSDVNVP